MKTIKFKGEDYLLVGDMIEGGPIATLEQYENGRCSYAHLYENGDIIRFGELIGNRNEIEVTGEIEASIKRPFLEMLLDPSWEVKK